jgi:hypothetical protein
MLVRSSIRGNVSAAKSRCLSQVEERYVTPLHNPFGCQSDAGVVAGCPKSCNMSTTALRVLEPLAVNSIGGPPGTIT